MRARPGLSGSATGRYGLFVVLCLMSVALPFCGAVALGGCSDGGPSDPFGSSPSDTRPPPESRTEPEGFRPRPGDGTEREFGGGEAGGDGAGFADTLMSLAPEQLRDVMRLVPADRLNEAGFREAGDTEGLGRDEGKRMLARFARALEGAAWALGAACIGGFVLSFIFGGIGRKMLAVGAACAAGLGVAAYFVRVYGFLVSEVISWLLLGALAAGSLAALAVGGHWLYEAWSVRKLARKRAVEGMAAPDVFSKLPVPVGVKKRLDDAWGAAMAGNADAAALVRRFVGVAPVGSGVTRG